MMRTFASLSSRALPGFGLLLLGALVLAGCEDNPVGRICDLGLSPGENESVVASPSLDCVTRTCLRVPQAADKPLPEGSLRPSGNLGLCTAECSGDDDCDKVPESPCQTGFTCAVPVVVGPFCCKKLCICKDYVVIPESGSIAEPAACNAGDSNNACCNLEGRPGNPDYPTCIAL
jgi:hypothetical protein